MLGMTRGKLCFCALYGTPIACKLALLRGTQALCDFRALALPFVLNIFANDVEHMLPIFDGLLEHLLLLQTNYYSRLTSLGLTGTGEFSDMTVKQISHGRIMRNHKYLCSMDDTDPGPDFCLLGERLHMDPEVPVADIMKALEESRSTYVSLQKFDTMCASHSVQIFHNPDQAMFEFMAFLTHFSRGFLFHVYPAEDSVEQNKQDWKAGHLHLKRAVLDMRKSIITTVFRNAQPGKIDHAFSKRLLKARQEEIAGPPEHEGKIEVYKPEVEEVLARDDWFE